MPSKKKGAALEDVTPKQRKALAAPAGSAAVKVHPLDGMQLAISQYAQIVRAGETGFVLTFKEGTPLDEWLGTIGGLRGRLEFNERVLPWIIGDALNFGEHEYGEKYSQALDETRYSVGTLRNFAWVAGQWKPEDRDPAKVFSLYKAATPLRKDAPKLAAKIVNNSTNNGHSHREVLDQVNQARAKINAAKVERGEPVETAVDEPEIIVGLHRPGCPTCTCPGSKPTE